MHGLKFLLFDSIESCRVKYILIAVEMHSQAVIENVSYNFDRPVIDLTYA